MSEQSIEDFVAGIDYSNAYLAAGSIGAKIWELSELDDNESIIRLMNCIDVNVATPNVISGILFLTRDHNESISSARTALLDRSKIALSTKWSWEQERIDRLDRRLRSMK